MIESQITYKCLASRLRVHSALLILFSIAILFCAPIALPAQGIGKASVQLIDGSSLECNIESIDQQGHVSGQGVPEGLNIADVLSPETYGRIYNMQ